MIAVSRLANLMVTQNSMQVDNPTQVLIIESDPATAELLRIILEDEVRCGTTWVRTPGEALCSLEQARSTGQGHPNLALLDIRDMERGGPGLAGGLEGLIETTGILPPVILMGAWPLDGVAEIAGRIKAVGVVALPFDIDDLLDNVRKVLSP